MFYDYCILGGGLAGLSLADALQAHNQSVVVLEKNEIGSGASGTPGGLVNPATGRKGTKSWKAEGCYRAIRENLEKIQNYSSLPFFHQNGVLRPAQSAKMAQKMKARFDETNWPKGWCHWLSERKIKRKHPGINCIDGGLWLPIGITVDVKNYLKAYSVYLKSKQVVVKINCNSKVNCRDGHWKLQFTNGFVKCEHLIFATGFGTVSHPFWKNLNLNPVKGQTAHFRAKKKLPFSHSVSGLGYIARLQNDCEFIQGSTYEHNFEDLNPNKNGGEYLHERLKRTLPGLAGEVELVSQWAGVRVSAPNRKPVIGEHSDYEKLHLFTGLGSKGLLYSKFAADHFADHLLEGRSVFEEVSIKRLFTKLNQDGRD